MATIDKEIQILMLKGQKGDKGSSIDRIEKTATSGLVDTYTVYLSDGTTTTFQVTNGKDGEVTQEQLDDLAQDVATNTSNITTNTNNINALTNAVNTNTSNIATNTSNITKNAKGIDDLRTAKLYLHRIHLTGQTFNVYFELFDNTDTPLTNIGDIMLRDNNWLAQGIVRINGNDYTVRAISFEINLEASKVYLNIHYYYGLNDRYEQFDLDTTSITITDNNPKKLFDLSNYTSLNAPVISDELAEESDINYYYVKATNTNPTSLGVYYKTSTDTDYSSKSISPNATVILGTYAEGTQGTAYFKNAYVSSNIIEWNL